MVGTYSLVAITLPFRDRVDPFDIDFQASSRLRVSPFCPFARNSILNLRVLGAFFSFSKYFLSTAIPYVKVLVPLAELTLSRCCVNTKRHPCLYSSAFLFASTCSSLIRTAVTFPGNCGCSSMKSFNFMRLGAAEPCFSAFSTWRALSPRNFIICFIDAIFFATL